MLGLGLSRIKSGIVPELPVFVNADPQNDRGFHFDGSSDFLSVADHDDFSFNTPTGSYQDAPFTWVGWVKQDNSSGSDALFMKATNTPSNQYEYRIFFQSGILFADVYDTTTSSYDRRNKSGAGSTAWTHWAITFNGNSGPGNVPQPFNFYKNGSNLGTLASGGSSQSDRGDMENTNSPFVVGSLRDTSTTHDFGGHMMQVMIFNKELTSDEVSYLYASGAAHRDPRFQTTTYAANNNLIAWWPLDDADGYEDHGNNGHDFTKNGDVELHTSADAPF